MNKEDEVMQFLTERVFNPILQSETASQNLKQGVRYTIMRLRERDAAGMIRKRPVNGIFPNCGTCAKISPLQEVHGNGGYRWNERG